MSKVNGMDNSNNEYGKLIVVDFTDKKVNLTFEYERRDAKFEQLQVKLSEILKSINEITGDRPYTRTISDYFLDILDNVERRKENKRDGV